MRYESVRERKLFGNWAILALVVGGFASTLGCSAETGEGSGGAGGTFGAVDSQDERGVRAADESIHDSRWDLPDGMEQVIAPPSNATVCTLGSQCVTGSCVDGFCCDSKCDNKCMACSAAKKGGGVDGICGSVKYDTDPDNDCPFGACDGKNQCKNYNGFSCTAAPQCLSNYCVDGVCCGNICMGACQACTAAKKGSGSDGVCGNIALNADPDNECTGSQCNGSGACQTAQSTAPNGTACTAATQCASGFCADGVCCDSWCLGTCQACTAAKKGSGSNGTCGNIANDIDPDEECWGGGCNGQGVCKQYNGVPCSDKSQCLSNYCVDGFCCGNICTGMCSACSEAKKGQGYDGVCGAMASGRDPENECNPGECNGSGTCNQPQTPQANGTTCVSSGQCASANCVDGYCCNTACTGTCQACSATKKGSGANGTCGPIAAETNPDGECNGGRCDGTGACRYYNGASCSSTTQCFSNYCVDGVCCGNVCTSSCYACSAAKKGQGNDGACGPIANTRDPDNECNPGECNGSGACNQSPVLQANGAACTLATSCLSGFCVDGVCCDAVCSGGCQACTATKKGSGTNGTCGNIKYDTDPDNECAAGACSGSGTCEQYNGASCTGTADCLSHYCVDGVCCGNICNGTCMACTAAKKGSGSDGGCGPIANGNDPDNECGATCNGAGACNKASNGSSCNANADCTSGFCVNGLCCNTACSGMCQSCVAPGSQGTCVNVCSNNCAATLSFSTNPQSPPIVMGIGQLHSADLNGDGVLDFLSVSASSISTRLGLGNGTFDAAVVNTISPAHFTQKYSALGDLNADGKPDLVCIVFNPFLEWHMEYRLNQGNGTFGARTDFNLYDIFADIQEPGGLVLGDFDGNGTLDVAASMLYRHPTWSVWIHRKYVKALRWLNNGAGTLVQTEHWAFNQEIMNFSYGSLAIAAGDFDGNAKVDLAIADHDLGGTRLFHHQGTSDLVPGTALPESLEIGTADLNGDGLVDMYGRFKASGKFEVWTNDGMGGFVNAFASLDPSPGTQVADLDGDGTKDLVFLASSNLVRVMLGLGNGSFAGPMDYPIGLAASSILVGDWNQDGLRDLAVRDSQSGDVSILFNTCTP